MHRINTFEGQRARSRPSLPLALAAASAGVLTPAVVADFIPPNDGNIRYTGRVDTSDPLTPTFGWPGTSLSARFDGTSLSVTLDDDGDNWVYVIIDDGDPVSVQLLNGPNVYVLATGLPDAVHSVEVVKKTEGCCEGNYSFLGFQTDPGRSLQPLPAPPSLRLEFYGDSNASGYSAECTCDSGNTQYKNNYFSFAGIASRMLGAEYSCMSWSGIGIVATPTDMTEVWDRVLPTSAAPLWGFTATPPDAVIINLGANDYYWNVNQPTLIQAWEDFVTNQIRSVYPDAHVVLVNSYGWADNEPADYVNVAVANLHAAGDTNVSFVLLPWLWGQQHAVVCEQAGFADIVASHLAAELGLPRPCPVDFSCLAETGHVANGGFERGSVTEVDGWRNFAPQSGTVQVIDDAGGAHTDDRYIRVHKGNSGSAGFYHGTPAVVGRSYTATAYMRATQGTQGKLRLEYKDTAQNVIQSVQGVQTLTGDWMQYSTTIGPAPVGTTQVTVVCVTDISNTTVDYDSVVLFPVACPGDVDESGAVDIGDLLQLLADWETCWGGPADLDHDVVIDVADLLILLGGWGACA